VARRERVYLDEMVPCEPISGRAGQTRFRRAAAIVENLKLAGREERARRYGSVNERDASTMQTCATPVCCGSFRSCGVDHERTLKSYFLSENADIVSLGFISAPVLIEDAPGPRIETPSLSLLVKA
jgi:hypothetical protein